MELAWLQEHLGARLKLKPAQHSYLRARRTRVDVDTIHIALRETYIKNVVDVWGLGDNKCKSMPTPIVQTRQKSDEDEPRLGEGDRRAYHRCVSILRHLLKYRPGIAFAVHGVSKTLASPGEAGLWRLRRLSRLFLGHTEAWHHDTEEQRILNILMHTEFTKGQSCQTLSSGQSEYDAVVTTTQEALLQRFLEFLGMPVKLRLRIYSWAARGIIQRQGCRLLKHIETRQIVASSET